MSVLEKLAEHRNNKGLWLTSSLVRESVKEKMDAVNLKKFQKAKKTQDKLDRAEYQMIKNQAPIEAFIEREVTDAVSHTFGEKAVPVGNIPEAYFPEEDPEFPGFCVEASAREQRWNGIVGGVQENYDNDVTQPTMVVQEDDAFSDVEDIFHSKRAIAWGDMPEDDFKDYGPIRPLSPKGDDSVVAAAIGRDATPELVLAVRGNFELDDMHFDTPGRPLSPMDIDSAWMSNGGHHGGHMDIHGGEQQDDDDATLLAELIQDNDVLLDGRDMFQVEGAIAWGELLEDDFKDYGPIRPLSSVGDGSIVVAVVGRDEPADHVLTPRGDFVLDDIDIDTPTRPLSPVDIDVTPIPNGGRSDVEDDNEQIVASSSNLRRKRTRHVPRQQTSSSRRQVVANPVQALTRRSRRQVHGAAQLSNCLNSSSSRSKKFRKCDYGRWEPNCNIPKRQTRSAVNKDLRELSQFDATERLVIEPDKENEVDADLLRATVLELIEPRTKLWLSGKTLPFHEEWNALQDEVVKRLQVRINAEDLRRILQSTKSVLRNMVRMLVNSGVEEDKMEEELTAHHEGYEHRKFLRRSLQDHEKKCRERYKKAKEQKQQQNRH